MRLRVFTDYSLRVLVYLASHPDRFVTITEIADAYEISGNHLMKVVQHLASTGEVATLRGPHGGLRLARPASAIRVGDVVRRTEPDFVLTKCGQGGGGLPTVLDRAMAAFMTVLDGCTVADLVIEKPEPEADHITRRAGGPSASQRHERGRGASDDGSW